MDKNFIYKLIFTQIMAKKPFGQCETKGGNPLLIFRIFFLSYNHDIYLNRIGMVDLVGKISISAHFDTFKP
jgi:hypothetical protein